MKLEEIYAQHPLSEQTILARIARQGRETADLSEWHLAIDPETHITDQNHPGGVQAVLELAMAARITRTFVVADVGAGLGGSARVLAQAFGCRVIAIERDQQRYTDALSLTRRVRLDSLVTIRKQDALRAPADLKGIDVLWGQAAWVHFPDPGAFLDIWVPTISHGGCVAMADVFLRRAPSTAAEADLLAGLERSWGAHLLPLSRWVDALEAQSFSIISAQERTPEASASFLRLIEAASRWPPGMATEPERAGWQRAIDAFSAGLLSAWQVAAARA